MSESVHLSRGTTSLVVDISGPPTIRYWGPALGDDPDPDLFDDPTPVGDLDRLAPVSILPEASLGFPGVAGVAGARNDGRDWAPRLRVESSRITDSSMEVDLNDPVAELGATVSVEIDTGGGVVSLSSELTNRGDSVYRLTGLTMTLPLPRFATEVVVLAGRWGNEMRAVRSPWRSGAVVVENRRGRTSHDRVPFIAAGAAGSGESRGRVFAAHLGWSGNSVVRVDTLSDGRRFLQAGELLLPGEVDLEPGQTYRSPMLHATCSDSGLNGVRAAFHGYLRARKNHPTSPRPVVLNTWEAVYFDHDLVTLGALAERAAEVGVERFVLDDGWFHGRRNDSAGLGDWWVDEAVWPDGLRPLIDRVTDLGMDFGIWVEPEMVNPDSDLYREHPDWVLTDHRYEPVLGRRQLVLDLVDPAVSAYLFEKLDRLLGDHEIAYVKWDMNRDLVHASHEGRPAVRAQTLALYALIDRLRSSHPTVEIESCASGGGRIDYGILGRADRIWTSDCNDALDRVAIQHGASLLLPPELMGAHIGAPRSHTTGRRHGLGFRATVAFFGHLGVEWNLLDADENELRDLARAIGLHKRHRPLLHTGATVAIDHPDPAVAVSGVVAEDRSEALFAVAQIATSDSLAVAPLRIEGLDPAGIHRVEMISLGRSPLGMASRHPDWIADGTRVTGRQLAAAGLPLPVLLPETARLVHVLRQE